MTRSTISVCLCLAVLAPAVAAQEVRRLERTPRPLALQAETELQRLNATAQAPFHLTRARAGDAIDVSGGIELARGATRAESSEAWIADHRALLSVPLEFAARAVESRSGAARARASFELGGLPVFDRYVTVSFDALDRIRSVHSFAPTASNALGPVVWSEDEALAAAGVEVRAHLQQLGRAQPASWRVPVAELGWEATSAGVIPVWRVRQFSQLGDLGFAVDVDARDGSQRRIRELVMRGVGNYPFFGNFVSFNTGTAKGVGFKDVAGTLNGVIKGQSLKSWALGVPQPVGFAKGFLVGAHVDVVDAQDQNLFASNGKFTAIALTGPDEFDKCNAYFQIEDNYAHLKKNLGIDLASNFALPFVVNFKDTTPNAFFSPDPFPGDGHVDGFMLFFDLDQVVGPAGDFSRDVTAVCHEYTHGWVNYEGEGFEGDLNFPTRAIGEAIADFYALCKVNDTFLGRYIDAVFPTLGIGRDLHDDDYFENTLADAIALTGDGMPEEHRSGETFGSLVTDFRLITGAKNAERVFFAALPGMPNTMDEIGYPVVDGTNAEVASADYFGTCAVALLDAVGVLPTSSRPKALGALIGASTARGVFGASASTVDVFVDLTTQPKGKLTIPSAFHDGTQPQTYFFAALQGKKLSVKIQAAGNSALFPDFQVRGANNEANAVTHTHTQSFTGNGHTTSESQILLNLPGTGIYAVDLISTTGGLGTYTLTLDV